MARNWKRFVLCNIRTRPFPFMKLSRPRSRRRLTTTQVLGLLFYWISLSVSLSAQTGLDRAPASAAEHVANLYDPAADSKATVLAGHARFTVLTPQLVRVEWAADGKFEDHGS